MQLAKEGKGYRDYLFILLGTGIMALNINSIFDPSSLVTGGFSGIAIIVKHLTQGFLNGGVPLWLTNAILNIPLFLLGFKVMGFHFLKKSLFGTVILSLWLYIIPVYPLVGDDLLLAAVFGGVLEGIGIGFVLMGQGTTGGTDMVATLIQHYFRHYSVPRIMQLADGLIVLAGIFIFGINRALYAAIAIFIVGKVSDGILEGMKFSKMAYIISSHEQEIYAGICERLDRGVTLIPARGMYTGQERNVLLCVVAKKEIIILKETVKGIDPDAFLIVSDAHEVLGEGFQNR